MVTLLSTKGRTPRPAGRASRGFSLAVGEPAWPHGGRSGGRQVDVACRTQALEFQGANPRTPPSSVKRPLFPATGAAPGSQLLQGSRSSVHRLAVALFLCPLRTPQVPWSALVSHKSAHCHHQVSSPSSAIVHFWFFFVFLLLFCYVFEFLFGFYLFFWSFLKVVLCSQNIHITIYFVVN